ncbi:2-C-methyl-D-erythritol 4-phosphate cytidylyltransferase [Desulfovibrio inopinatus]|uniref:2-C-methyl-D-erythritol 4-phosphate cytidylyltransferase n=1 Tax=Desulfovibrio inopinatus TaxID=102109 RepID=UPI0004169E1E|nr:2-C-methyl-D-erythritol 4-phosphate cytidylyltransferase [Desulfovibrio inopinatus]
MSVWGIILAAGQGSRLKEAGLAVRKQFIEYENAPLFWRSARTFAMCPALSGLVFVFPPEEFNSAQQTVNDLFAKEDLGLPYLVTAGGVRRQDSVENGMNTSPKDADVLLVHDAARPFFSPRIVTDLLTAIENGAHAAVPAIPVKDTVKVVHDDVIETTLQRSHLAAVQTPQAVRRPSLLKAFAKVKQDDFDVTDDASLIEHLGLKAVIVPGDERNIKITTPEDLELLRPKDDPMELRLPRVGYGYDVHRYADPDAVSRTPPRPMKLGTVPIPGAPAVLAHSDGDVLLHALADALLGCLVQGDIGHHFPDSDPAYDNMESAVFISEIMESINTRKMTIHHVDLTIICQIPKVGPHRANIQKNVARLLEIGPGCVNVKATTEEGLGFTGEKKGIKAVALVTVLA